MLNVVVNNNSPAPLRGAIVAPPPHESAHNHEWRSLRLRVTLMTERRTGSATRTHFLSPGVKSDTDMAVNGSDVTMKKATY